MSEIAHVFAKATTTVGDRFVQGGSHWPADDPLVRAHPDAFSADPRYGMSWSSAEPPAYMSEPPVEQTTARAGEARGAVRRG